MKIVEFNPFNKEHQALSNIYNDKSLSSIITSYKSEDEYNEQKYNSNNIYEAIVDIENNNIKNHCIFMGTRDNRLIQLQLGNLVQKKFLLESINYAFSRLNAYTITIFTDKDTPLLESIGFENLGGSDKTTYIMEREMEKEIGSVRK